jgi:hypothetical protein
VRAQALGELPPHREDRVQGRRRLLEDHRRLRAAHPAHRLAVEADDIGAVEHDRAALCGGLGQQAEDRPRRDGLAAAGLADDREHLAGPDVERHVAHGVDIAPVGREGDVEVTDLDRQIGVRGHHGTSPRISRAAGCVVATASCGSASRSRGAARAGAGRRGR